MTPVRVMRITLRESDGEPSSPPHSMDPFPAQLCQASVKLPGWSNASTGLCSEQGTAQAGQHLAKNNLKKTFWQPQSDYLQTFLTPGKQGQFAFSF